jgi:hypothetical protein
MSGREYRERIGLNERVFRLTESPLRLLMKRLVSYRLSWRMYDDAKGPAHRLEGAASGVVADLAEAASTEEASTEEVGAVVGTAAGVAIVAGVTDWQQAPVSASVSDIMVATTATDMATPTAMGTVTRTAMLAMVAAM